MLTDDIINFLAIVLPLIKSICCPFLSDPQSITIISMHFFFFSHSLSPLLLTSFPKAIEKQRKRCSSRKKRFILCRICIHDKVIKRNNNNYYLYYHKFKGLFFTFSVLINQIQSIKY